MTQDTIALLTAFIYVFAMIGVAEGLRKWRGYSVEFTRKFIHIAVGMWAYGAVLMFESRTFAIIPPLAFVAINALSYWKGTFKAMETGEKGQLGTIYFPISFAALIWLLWHLRIKTVEAPAGIVAYSSYSWALDTTRAKNQAGMATPLYFKTNAANHAGNT